MRSSKVKVKKSKIEVRDIDVGIYHVITQQMSLEWHSKLIYTDKEWRFEEIITTNIYKEIGIRIRTF